MSSYHQYYHIVTHDKRVLNYWYQKVRDEMGRTGILSLTTTLLLEIMPGTTRYIQDKISPRRQQGGEATVSSMIALWRKRCFTPQRRPTRDWFDECIRYGHHDLIGQEITDLDSVISQYCVIGLIHPTLELIERSISSLEGNKRAHFKKWRRVSASCGHVELYRALCKLSPISRETEDHGYYMAAWDFDMNKLAQLVESKGTDWAFSHTDKAIRSDHLEVFVILTQGREPNNSSVHRWYFTAVEHIAVKTLSYLIEKYPKFSIRDLFESSIFHWHGDKLSMLDLLECGNTAIIELVMKKLCDDMQKYTD